MPTKTVLFTDLDKYDNKGKRFLRSDEYLQMSGRAGRRGLDEFGSVILLPTFDLLSEIELKSIMIGKSPSVKSKFNLSYQFVLKSMLLETKNINDIISNTLIRNEYKKISNGLQHRNEELEILLEKYAFNEDELKVLKRYDDIYNKMNSTIFTLKKKDYQKLELEKKNIESEKDFQNSYKRYQEYTTLLKEFDSNNNSIDHNETDILNQIDVIKSVLKEYEYIKDDDLNKNDLTKKGIIASAVNDCNELLFTEMIFQGYLDNLTFPEIIGLLSTFINEKDGEDKYLNDLNISDNLYNAIKNLQKLSIKLEDNESNKGLFLKMDYNLYLDFIEPAYIWASGGSIQEIYSVTAIYDGNFVKAIMRINNICDNLMDICKTIERYDICAKLENSTSILIRDITTINSLYVN
jgi:superfamily II RNA helicase